MLSACADRMALSAGLATLRVPPLPYDPFPSIPGRDGNSRHARFERSLPGPDCRILRLDDDQHRDEN
jgi:hypothetical protein